MNGKNVFKANINFLRCYHATFFLKGKEKVKTNIKSKYWQNRKELKSILNKSNLPYINK